MTLTYAVIGTFYKRHENSLPILKRLLEQTRVPNEAWLMCETPEDVAALTDAARILYELEVIDRLPPWLFIRLCPTPRTATGEYAVLPYAHKINDALELSGVRATGAVVYLDNNSMPGPDKYRVMIEALETNPTWGAVYCTQKRTGFAPTVCEAIEPVADAFCVLNYTQVMHRRTPDRWPTDMALANPDLADGYFWRTLHERVGAFHPAGGTRIHDDHHIPTPAAAL